MDKDIHEQIAKIFKYYDDNCMDKGNYGIERTIYNRDGRIIKKWEVRTNFIFNKKEYNGRISYMDLEDGQYSLSVTAKCEEKGKPAELISYGQDNYSGSTDKIYSTSAFKDYRTGFSYILTDNERARSIKNRVTKLGYRRWQEVLLVDEDVQVVLVARLNSKGEFEHHYFVDPKYDEKLSEEKINQYKKLALRNKGYTSLDRYITDSYSGNLEWLNADDKEEYAKIILTADDALNIFRNPKGLNLDMEKEIFRKI